MPDLVTVVTLEPRAQLPTPLAIFDAPIFVPTDAYGPERVRRALLQAIKLLLQRADALSRHTTGRRGAPCPPFQS